MSKFTQKHARISFCSKLKSKSAIRFEKKQSAKQKSAKNKPKKQATRKSSKNPQINKKQAQIGGKAARLATLIVTCGKTPTTVT